MEKEKKVSSVKKDDTKNETSNLLLDKKESSTTSETSKIIIERDDIEGTTVDALVIDEGKSSPVKPKTSPEGMAKWLGKLFMDIHGNVLTATEMKGYDPSFSRDITVAITKLNVARDLVGKCIKASGGKVPAIEE